MRINMNSFKCAAIGEMYKRGHCGMEIMDFIVAKEQEADISRSIERLQQRLVDTRAYNADIATKLQVTQREMDAFSD